MRFVFAILKLRPLGGKERDCIGLAEQFTARGHTVTIATTEPPAVSLPRGVKTVLVPISAWSNHGRHRAFAEAMARMREGAGGDAILLAFDRIPCADYLFAATLPHRPSAAWKRMLPRHRTLTMLEADAFGGRSRAFAFFLTHMQAARYEACYGAPGGGSAVLPISFGLGRSLPERHYASRSIVRSEFGIPSDAPLLIHVGVNGRLKGLDRVIDVLSRLQDAHLLAVGEDSLRFRWRARRRGVEARVRFTGYAADLPRLIGAADLMVHPAREENTGTVILESLLYGVPAIVSAECGYAEHVQRAGAGAVLASPFDAEALATEARAALEPQRLEILKACARRYAPIIVAEGGIEAVAEAMLAVVAARTPAPKRETGSDAAE
jgi:UDP-glucose:(heptosyl)LPS alpha-1,3-glucosyltransferase